jgi:major type 1 subunit fimbrin (pilin)
MKNIFTTSAVAASLLVAFAASAAPTNGNGSIQFTGNVVDNGCDVIVAPSHNVATASASSIDLKTADRASLGTEVGSIANKTAFSLTLKNCPATLNNASANFDYTADSTNEGFMKNLSTNNGVAMQLFDDSNAGLALVKGVPSAAVAINNGNALLPFSVALVNTVGTGVQAGLVSATTQYTIVYQ